MTYLAYLNMKSLQTKSNIFCHNNVHKTNNLYVLFDVTWDKTHKAFKPDKTSSIDASVSISSWIWSNFTVKTFDCWFIVKTCGSGLVVFLGFHCFDRCWTAERNTAWSFYRKLWEMMLLHAMLPRRWVKFSSTDSRVPNLVYDGFGND